MKSQNRFRLHASTSFSEEVELIKGFYITDSHSRGEKTEIVEDPLSHQKEIDVDYEDFLTLINQEGYRLANWREIEILKRFLSLDPCAEGRILIYQEEESGLNGIHPYRPFKEFFSFEDRNFLRRLFEDSYPIDNEDKIVLVCVRLK